MPHPAHERLVRALRRTRLGALLVAPLALLGPNGYAGGVGWLRSTVRQSSVDREGEPVPWMTYPLVHFLERRLRADMRVFEYGSGHSTLWFADRVAEVVSCDDAPDWTARIRRRAPDNVRILEIDGIDEYPSALAGVDGRFGIVVIDGRRRADCAAAAADSDRLDPRGVILWDDTERHRYRAGIEGLRARGFRQLPFHGLGPILAYGFESSLFYRPGNCLGI